MFSKIEITPDQTHLDLISLSDAKHQLNIIDFEEHDEIIKALIPSSFDIISKATNQAFLNCMVHVSVDASELPAFLPVAPLPDSLNTVTQAGYDVGYKYDPISGMVSLTEHVTGDIVITYNTGYDADSLPEGLKHIVRMTLSELYRHRGDTTSEAIKTVPMGIRALLQSYKWSGI